MRQVEDRPNRLHEEASKQKRRDFRSVTCKSSQIVNNPTIECKVIHLILCIPFMQTFQNKTTNFLPKVRNKTLQIRQASDK